MDKAELRRAMIARRDDLDLDVRAAKSAVICARLVELLDRLDAATPHTVAAYAAMGSEVDPAAFAAAAAKRGWRVAYPCILSATDAAACGQRMCMRAVAGGDASAAPFIAHPTRAFAAMDIDSDIRVMETMLRRDSATVADDFGLGGGTAVQQEEE